MAGEFDAWLYFYTDFPIVRWHDGAYQAWSFGEGGASALAVREERVLLFGEDARIVELGPDGTARVAEHVAVEDDRGISLAGAQVFGVADALYFFQDGRVLVVDGW